MSRFRKFVRNHKRTKSGISEIVASLILILVTVSIGVLLLGIATNTLSIGALNQSNQASLASQQLQERIMVSDVWFHQLLTYSEKNSSSLTEPFTATAATYVPAFKSIVVGAVLSNIGTGSSVTASSSYTLTSSNPALTNGADQFAEYSTSLTKGSTSTQFSISGSNTGIWYGEVSVAFPTAGSGSIVQQSSGQKASGTGSSLACNFANPVASGDILLAFVGVVSSTNTQSLSDTLGNTYTSIVAAKVSATSPATLETAYYSVARSAGSDSITATVSSGATPTMFINCMEISGASVNPSGMEIHLINYGLVYVNIVSIYANLSGSMAPLSNFTSVYPSGVTVAPSSQLKIVFPYAFAKGHAYQIELVSDSGSTFTSIWSA